MTTSKRLAAHRASAANEDPQVSPAPVGPGKDEKTTNPDKETPNVPTEEEMAAAAEAARKEAHTSGFKAANERMNKVLASDHYVGREALAQSLLASESLSAEDIIGHLEKANKPSASTAAPTLSQDQQRAAAEEAGRKEMQAALEQTTNSNIDADGGKQPDKKAEADSVWAKAYGLNKEGK